MRFVWCWETNSTCSGKLGVPECVVPGVRNITWNDDTKHANRAPILTLSSHGPRVDLHLRIRWVPIRAPDQQIGDRLPDIRVDGLSLGHKCLGRPVVFQSPPSEVRDIPRLLSFVLLGLYCIHTAIASMHQRWCQDALRSPRMPFSLTPANNMRPIPFHEYLRQPLLEEILDIVQLLRASRMRHTTQDAAVRERTRTLSTRVTLNLRISLHLDVISHSLQRLERQLRKRRHNEGVERAVAH